MQLNELIEKLKTAKGVGIIKDIQEILILLKPVIELIRKVFFDREVRNIAIEFKDAETAEQKDEALQKVANFIDKRKS